MKIAVFVTVLSAVLATSAIAKPYPTTISENEVTEVIRQNLQYHAPRYIVFLDGAYPHAGVRDLVRAGFLGITSKTIISCLPQWSLYLTKQGRSLSEARGWSVSVSVHDGMRYDGMLTIQAGSLEYVPKSATVLRDAGRPDAIRFKFKYVPSSNANTLLRIGPARDWKTGDGFTLADAGHIYERTVVLSYNAARGWYVRNEWAWRPVVTC